jgi:hypothetical protein
MRSADDRQFAFGIILAVLRDDQVDVDAAGDLGLPRQMAVAALRGGPDRLDRCILSGALGRSYVFVAGRFSWLEHSESPAAALDKRLVQMHYVTA